MQQRAVEIGRFVGNDQLMFMPLAVLLVGALFAFSFGYRLGHTPSDRALRWLLYLTLPVNVGLLSLTRPPAALVIPLTLADAVLAFLLWKVSWFPMLVRPTFLAGVASVFYAGFGQPVCLLPASCTTLMLPPELVFEGYAGYNVIAYREPFVWYYAISQEDGAFTLDRYFAGKYHEAVDGAVLSEVLAEIDQKAARSPYYGNGGIPGL